MVGETNSQINMPQSIMTIVVKNMAVGLVQYIHSRPIAVPF